MNPRNALSAVAFAASLCSLSAAAHAASTVVPNDPNDPTGATDATHEPAATPEVDAWQAHRLALLAHLGVGAPIGVLGLSGEYAFTPWASAGLGVGSVDGKSANVAAMGRWRLPLGEHFGTGVGVGASFGRPFTIDLHFCWQARCPDAPPPEYVLAADGEVYLEGRADFGLVARLYGGLHQGLTKERPQNGYAGLAVGWSF